MTTRIAEPIPATFHQVISQVAKKKAPDGFTVVSLFSGCGGPSLRKWDGTKTKIDPVINELLRNL